VTISLGDDEMINFTLRAAPDASDQAFPRPSLQMILASRSRLSAHPVAVPALHYHGSADLAEPVASKTYKKIRHLIRRTQDARLLISVPR